MVRLLSDQSKSIQLRVASGGQRIERAIALTANQPRDEFVRLAGNDDAIEIEIVGQDGCAADKLF